MKINCGMIYMSELQDGSKLIKIRNYKSENRRLGSENLEMDDISEMN